MYDISQHELVLALAAKLKETIKMPDWASFVKTGAHKETLPKHPDWWYIRAASILRTIHLKGPVGVSKLRIRYGGRKNRGYKPSRFVPGSGKIIRTIVQQLEKAQLVKEGKVGLYKGRITTAKGNSFLMTTAKEVLETRLQEQKTQEKQDAVKKEVVEKKADDQKQNIPSNKKEAPAEKMSAQEKKAQKESSKEKKQATEQEPEQKKQTAAEEKK